VWLVAAVVCLLAAPWVQLSISAGSGWPYAVLLPISRKGVGQSLRSKKESVSFSAMDACCKVKQASCS